jgi:excinuclease UvrABC helicase subunit UvrB
MSKIKFFPKRKYKAVRNYLHKISDIIAYRKAELESLREVQPLSEDQLNRCTDFEIELEDAFQETEILRNYISDLQEETDNESPAAMRSEAERYGGKK